MSELVHRFSVPFRALCGADQPNQITAQNMATVNCPSCVNIYDLLIADVVAAHEQRQQAARNAIEAAEEKARNALAAAQRTLDAHECDVLALRAELDSSRAGNGRKRLPDERRSLTHHFEINARNRDGEIEAHDGYLTVGLYEDGSPGELFVRHGKASPDLWRGLLDDFAVAVSLALQYGADVETIARKFRGTRYEPSGYTANPKIPRCTSPTDYIARWLLLKFTKPEDGGQES